MFAIANPTQTAERTVKLDTLCYLTVQTAPC